MDLLSQYPLTAFQVRGITNKLLLTNHPVVGGLQSIHTLRVPYAHAAANLNSGYSKYGKEAYTFVQLHSEHLAQC